MKDENLNLSVPGHDLPDCSRDIVSHYSFDFAQQIHYPSNPQQPGPIYFKTPRKCGVFGVLAEALPQMVLFLLDEGVDTGKGANTVISMLHFFLTIMVSKKQSCTFMLITAQGKTKTMQCYSICCGE